MGSAYEWLIKYFADSAGKKAGEFYAPAEVGRVCVEICDPQPNMSIYDSTVGFGGMLIQARDYIRECGGDDSDLALYGQEKMGTTWFYLQNEYAVAWHLQSYLARFCIANGTNKTCVKFQT